MSLRFDEQRQVPNTQNVSDVEFSPPFAAPVNELSNHKTYLDSIGRPKLTLKYKDLTLLHAQKIYVRPTYTSSSLTIFMICR